MTPEQEKKLDDVRDGVNAMHTAIFGTEGHGGLHSWVQSIDKDVDELKGFKARAAGISLAVSAIVAWTISWFKK